MGPRPRRGLVALVTILSVSLACSWEDDPPPPDPTSQRGSGSYCECVDVRQYRGSC